MIKLHDVHSTVLRYGLSYYVVLNISSVMCSVLRYSTSNISVLREVFYHYTREKREPFGSLSLSIMNNDTCTRNSGELPRPRVLEFPPIGLFGSLYPSSTPPLVDGSSPTVTSDFRGVSVCCNRRRVGIRASDQTKDTNNDDDVFHTNLSEGSRK